MDTTRSNEIKNQNSQQQFRRAIVISLGVLVATMIGSQSRAEDCNSNGIPDEMEVPGTTNLFNSIEEYSVVGRAAGQSFCDVDNDGDFDLLIYDQGKWPPSSYPRGLGVLFNNGHGIFYGYTVYSSGTDLLGNIDIGDLNNDGSVEAISPITGSGELNIYFNSGDGDLSNVVTVETGGHLEEAKFADINNDDYLDIIALLGSEYQVAVFLNNGDSSFGNGVTYDLINWPVGAVSADFDGNGNSDLAISVMDFSTAAVGYLSVLLNNGDGTLAPEVVYSLAGRPRYIKGGDIDVDGDTDLIVLSYPSIMSVFRNLGDGSFAPRVDYSLSSTIYTADVADFDGDGDIDLASPLLVTDTVEFRWNDGSGGFAQSTLYPMDTPIVYLAGGDIDNDGDMDITISTGEEGVSIFVLRHANGDCNSNGIPDDCEADCNANGILDECDIRRGGSLDCNSNGIPDDCEQDDDNDTIPNDCDVCFGGDDRYDFDGDGLPNACDEQCGVFAIGDVDGSGEVDVADVPLFATILTRPMAGVGSEYCAADVNQDDFLSAADIGPFMELILAP